MMPGIRIRRRAASALVATAGLLGACSDSPTGPVQDEPTAPAAAPAVSTYDVSVRYVGYAASRHREAVASAVARWASVITDDLPAVPIRSAAGECFDGQPTVNESVDDLVLFVDFAEIDGAGRILGEAGPCYVRMESSLPIIGYLKLDAADLREMERRGTLNDVVLHEIGHVLGIGTLWESAGVLIGSGSADPYFTGERAVSAYRVLGGSTTGVPVENTGGAGTRDGHWRESVFDDELMTGFISSASNPLSALTIGSLLDIGYGASMAAASGYALHTGTRSITGGMDLRGRERLRPPRFNADRNGNASPWGREIRAERRR